MGLLRYRKQADDAARTAEDTTVCKNAEDTTTGTRNAEDTPGTAIARTAAAADCVG